MTPSLSAVTILRGAARERRAVLTKRWLLGPDGKPRKFDAALPKQFTATVRPANDIHELGALLTELEADPHAMVIRGELLPSVDLSKPVHRRMKGPGAAFRAPAQGRHWVMLDFDKARCPVAIDPITNPEEAIEHLVGLLPEPFHDVTCYWQLSSSAGMGPNAQGTISAHVWFWFDRPVTDAELKRLADQINKGAGVRLIDPAVFNPVQPHYTAAPLFDPGVRDPLVGRRSGLRTGLEDAVAFPSLEGAAAEGEVRATGRGLADTPRGFDGWLAKLGDGAGLAGFNDPLLRASASYVRKHGAAGTDPEALKQRLREAIDAAPRSTYRPLSEIQRYKSDRYLDELITGALKKFAPPAPVPVPAAPVREPRPLADAERKLTEEVQRFFRDASKGMRFDPLVRVIRAQAGLGKSEAVLRELAKLEGGRGSVVYLVPDIELARQLEARFREIAGPNGPRSRVFRGRGQVLPSGEPMCPKAALAQRVGELGGGVKRSLCEGASGERCEHHPERGGSCPYMHQFDDPLWEGVTFASHNHLFQHSEGGPLERARVVIIDESFFAASLHGLDERGLFVDIDRLDAPRNFSGTRLTDEEIARYEETCRAIRSVLRAESPTVEALQAAGVAREALANCARVEAALFEGLGLTPDMSAKEQGERLAQFNDVPEARRRHRLWSLLGALIDTEGSHLHCLDIRLAEQPPEGPRARVYMRWSDEVVYLDPDGGPNVPATLILDATADERIVRRFFPSADPIIDIAADRQIEVWQIADTANPMSRLAYGRKPSEADPEELQRCANRLRELAEWAEVTAAEVGADRTAAISYQHTVSRTQWPAGVETTWFRRTRGLDGMKRAVRMIVAGRLQPPPRAVEAQAAALFWREPCELKRVEADAQGRVRYPRVQRPIEMRDGACVPVPVDEHPDPVCQSVLQQIREAELVQAIDRARGVRRGWGEGARVVLATNVPLPGVIVDRVISRADLVPSRLDVMRTRGLVPVRWGDMGALYPSVLAGDRGDDEQQPTADAVRMRVQREIDGMGRDTRTFPYEKILIGECSGFSVVTSKCPGKPGRPAIFLWNEATRHAASVLAELERLHPGAEHQVVGTAQADGTWAPPVGGPVSLRDKIAVPEGERSMGTASIEEFADQSIAHLVHGAGGYLRLLPGFLEGVEVSGGRPLTAEEKLSLAELACVLEMARLRHVRDCKASGRRALPMLTEQGRVPARMLRLAVQEINRSRGRSAKGEGQALAA